MARILIIDDDPEIQSLIVQVLCRMPDMEYVVIKESIDLFDWFIPPAGRLANVQPFIVNQEGEELPTQQILEGGKVQPSDVVTKPFAAVIYLSPLLEHKNIPDDVVVGSVARQLAHVCCGHRLFVSPDEVNQQSKEGADTLTLWGFGKEWEALERWQTEQPS